MKAHKEKPATDRNGRRSKFWNGWTPRVIAAHIGLLERHTPCAFYSLIYPRRNAPKLHLLRLGMSRLNKAVTDACHRYGYLGAWCLFYENGSKTRHHFHLWFTEPPSAALQAAVCKYWLKHTGQTDNATKVFHASGPARAVGDVKSYLSKHHKNGWLTKAPQVFLLDPKLRFKPFSFHKGKPLAGKLAPAALGARPKLTPGSASGSDFSPGKVTFSEGSFPPLQKASSVSEGTGRVNGVEHIDYPSSEGGYGMGKGDRPSGPTIASGRPLRAGVRIVTNHGPISRVIPDPRDTKAHLERLISDGFPIVAVLDADPLRPETVIECVFQVPAGGMVDFERLAGSYRHARIFRPAEEARFHHLQPTLKP